MRRYAKVEMDLHGPAEKFSPLQAIAQPHTTICQNLYQAVPSSPGLSGPVHEIGFQFRAGSLRKT